MIKKLFTPFVLWYLRKAASIQLRKTHPLIIGVAGSSGKSTLASLITGVLATHYSVNTTKEKNSETGIPLHLLNIHIEPFSYFSYVKALVLIPFRLLFFSPKYDILVAEMGIDSPVEPKNMSYLLKIIQPTIGVVTNITPEHSVYFDPYVSESNELLRTKRILQLTAKQEMLLLKSLPQIGFAVVNLDDPSIVQGSYKLDAKKITISTKDKSATLFAGNISFHPTHLSMDIVYKNETYALQTQQALPKHFAYAFLCTCGVGLAVGLTIREIIADLEKHLSLPPSRMSIFEGVKQTTIIDSSYNNATLPPALDMLDFLKDVAGTRRKVAIIGDMRELGSQSRENHEILAKKLLTSANLIILIGPLMRNYALPLLKARKANYFAFDTFTQAKDTILHELREKDVVLVKSSQNTLFLERVVEMLLKNQSDVTKLCRRGPFWDKKRAQSL